MKRSCAVLSWLVLTSLASASGDAPPATANVPKPPTEVLLDIHKFEVVERDSGPVSYYRFFQEQGTWMVRAQYRPPLETVTLGMELPDALHRAKHLRWRWRVLAFPEGSDECRSGKSDSPAGVFVTFKRGLKYYILKYTWSLEPQKGSVCNQKRNIFLARDTIVLESGGPVNTWITEEIDPGTEYVRHFGGGLSDVPDLVGIGLLTDGDQSKSRSEADYADFSGSF